MSNGYFAGFVDYEKRHKVAKCRWCGGAFVRYFAQWVCENSECQERCAEHAVVKPDVVEGESPFLYLPLPLQVEIEMHPARRLLIEGPAGYGKSYSARWSLYKLCLKHRGFQGLLIRCTYDQLNRNHLQFVDDEIRHFEGAKFHNNTQEPRHINFSAQGSKLFFGYCEHSKHIGQYKGPEYDRVCIEEASEVINDGLAFIVTRDRGSAPGREAMLAAGFEHGTSRLLTNPGGRSALFLRDHYIDRAPDPVEYPHYNADDYASINGRIEDNPYLAHDHKSSGLGGLDKATYAQQAEGRWDVFPGQFFPDFVKEQHVVGNVYDGTETQIAVLLYGFHTPGVLFIARLMPNGRIHIDREWKFKQTTIADVAIGVQARLPEKMRIVCPTDMVDDSEPDAIKAEPPIAKFARHGIALTPVEADAFGWDHVHDYLRPAPDGQPWLTVSPSCNYLARTLPTLIADENHPDELAKGQDDRAALALRTLLASRPLPSAKAVANTPPAEYSLAWFKRRDERPRGVLSLGR